MLPGEQHDAAYTDCNHNAKSIRYQLIGGSGSVLIGYFHLDVGILSDVGVPEKCWRVKDYANDSLVLKLASSDTISKLMTSTEDGRQVAVLALTLYFLRLMIYAVNAKALEPSARVVFLWSSLIWFSTCKGISMITVRNLVRQIVPMVFVIMRRDCPSPRLTTTEILEHKFGTYRSKDREFTCAGYVDLSDEGKLASAAISQSGLVTPGTASGYRATADSLNDSMNHAKRSNSAKRGTVDPFSEITPLAQDESVCGRVWEHSLLVWSINTSISEMKKLLEKLGVSDQLMSPFCGVPYSQYETSDLDRLHNTVKGFRASPRAGTGGAGAGASGGAAVAGSCSGTSAGGGAGAGADAHAGAADADRDGDGVGGGEQMLQDLGEDESNEEDGENALTPLQQSLLQRIVTAAAEDVSVGGQDVEDSRNRDDEDDDDCLGTIDNLNNLLMSENEAVLSLGSGLPGTTFSQIVEGDYSSSKAGFESTATIQQGISSLTMKDREKGVDQDCTKFKELLSRWIVCTNSHVSQSQDDDDDKYKRGVVVELFKKAPSKAKPTPEVYKDKYRILATYDKYYNKYFMRSRVPSGQLDSKKKKRAIERLLVQRMTMTNYASDKEEMIWKPPTSDDNPEDGLLVSTKMVFKVYETAHVII
jgi:hypothetical protein